MSGSEHKMKNESYLVLMLGKGGLHVGSDRVMLVLCAEGLVEETYAGALNHV